MSAQVHDDRLCELGEGAFWHPERGEIFWFDILGRKLLSRDASGPREWRFPEMVSAAGWLDRDRLLIAGETALFAFHLETGAREDLASLEAENPVTRSNDGRADRQGGFWIGTMGKQAQQGAGAIYRWRKGELRRLFPGLTIPNAISFAPDGASAHFADTRQAKIWRVALDSEGWPRGEPELFLDFTAEGLNPDGAVTDAAGRLWVAQWGAGRVAAYDAQGRFLEAVTVGAPHTSCPAFGGPDFSTLYCATAQEGLDAAGLAAHPLSGALFAAFGHGPGLPEPRVRL